MHISPFSITRNLLAAMPSDATCADRLVACVLASYANNETGELWPHTKAIAALSGMQPRGVLNCISRLERWGLIETGGRHVRPGGHWRYSPAQRRLTLPGLRMSDGEDSFSDADVHADAGSARPRTSETVISAPSCMASGASPCMSLKGTTKEELPKGGSPSYPPHKDSTVDASTDGRSLTLAVRAPSPPGFDDFWAQYPRKVGKEAALKAWRSAVLKAAVVAIMAGLAKQLGAGALDRGRFTPHPATWLNQGRWDDDPQASANLAEDTSGHERTWYDALSEIWAKDHPNAAA